MTRAQDLRAAGDRALQLVQPRDLPCIGSRWTPGPGEYRESAAGRFEQVNPRDLSLDADVIQRALLCKVPPPSDGLITSWTKTAAVLAVIAAIGVLLAWRG